MTSARMFKGQWADGPGWRKGTYERRSEKRLKSEVHHGKSIGQGIRGNGFCVQFCH